MVKDKDQEQSNKICSCYPIQDTTRQSKHCKKARKKSQIKRKKMFIISEWHDCLHRKSQESTTKLRLITLTVTNTRSMQNINVFI